MATHDKHIQAPDSAVEVIKRESAGLRGYVGTETANESDHYTEDSVQLLKHHGVYQQDNRDTRLSRKKEGLGREYTMMARTKFPGGSISALQYLICDDLADKYGQGDFRATTRQCFQFHGVVKGDLRPLLHDLNELARITTLGACGDVVRNTTAPAVADIDPAHEGLGINLQELAQRISNHFLPRTTAYVDLWINDEKMDIGGGGSAGPVDEPVYGATYLPRKFKIGIAADFDNSVDVYTNDIGLIAVTEQGRCAGFEILVGGGLGFSHSRGTTYPRLASPLAFVTIEELMPALEAIVKVQRDFGDRSNRKHARMKYLIDDLGLDAFRERVFEYAGKALDPPRGITPAGQPDYLGWHVQLQPKLNYVGLWIENGRIKDVPGGPRYKSGLRVIVERYGPSVRLTPEQNVILADIRDEDVAEVQHLLDGAGIPVDGVPAVKRRAMACPALPLCPLATAEAERVLPGILDELAAAGHGGDEVSIRMSGCPNSCSRPQTADIGLIGKGNNQYALYVGGTGTGRMGAELMSPVKQDEIVPVLSRLLSAWHADRFAGEAFGDWALRTGLETLRDLPVHPVVQ